MNRREILYQMLGLSLTGSVSLAQQPHDLNIPLSAAEAMALGLPKFFSAAELKDFAALSALLMPEWDGRPGAKQAGAAEFLDFLLSVSPADAQALYRNGVRQLSLQSRARFKQIFASLKPEQAAEILKPLSAPWTYEAPPEPFAKFLNAAKIAVYQATQNSREYAAAMSPRSRAAAGVGSYFMPVSE